MHRMRQFIDCSCCVILALRSGIIQFEGGSKLLVNYRTTRVAAICVLLAAQFCAAAPVRTDTPAARVNLRGAAAPSDVRVVADWLLRNNKHQGNPFIVADKVGGLVFAFDASGKLLAKAPALFGKVRSDVLTP